MNDWHTCKASGEIRASIRARNTCSWTIPPAIWPRPLITFYNTTTKSFDVDAYEHLCACGPWCSKSVMMAQFPSKAIADVLRIRTLGTRLANIGDC